MWQRFLIALLALLCHPLQGGAVDDKSAFTQLQQGCHPLLHNASDQAEFDAFLLERNDRAQINSMAMDNVVRKATPKIPKDYYLPRDHPARPILARIFADPDVLASIQNLKAAGFIKPVERKRGMIVGIHPKLQGWLLKMYIDSYNTDEVYQLAKRIDGARLVERSLDKFRYNDIMKVPKKWLYKVPNAKNLKANHRKSVVLVAENMDIFSDPETWKHYRTIVQPFHLDALYNVLTDCKLSDSTWILNIPFARDGKIAFVDTEFAGRSLLIWDRLPNLGKYLCEDMRRYWFELIDKGGPNMP